MFSKAAVFNMVLKFLLLITHEVASECEKFTTDHIINVTPIDKRIGDNVTIDCKLTDSTKEQQVRWEHLYGVVRRVFTESYITLLNISYLDIGTYRCIDITSCVLKEVTLNVQGAPSIIRTRNYVEMSDEMAITFTIETISFPPPDRNVTVRLCSQENKGSLFDVQPFSSWITLFLNSSEYSTAGYNINLTLNVEKLTENGLYCVDISNKLGKTSFSFYGNFSGVNDVMIKEKTFLLFLEENVTIITLGGLGLLSLVFVLTIFVLCKKLKKGKIFILSKLFNAMQTRTSVPSSHSYKMTQLSNDFFQDPVPCQTGTFTTRSIQMRDKLYDPNGIPKNFSGRMDSRVYSFGQSEPEYYEDDF
ncbi:uncharacterized protein LOC134234080 [Saccostrea cucullata]|uniref:uncharacterized protein LOC134234080 n=1 Tax=Saccostrea cuccullata TaxID=36930 RepID=UPI002ECFE28B